MIKDKLKLKIIKIKIEIPYTMKYNNDSIYLKKSYDKEKYHEKSWTNPVNESGAWWTGNLLWRVNEEKL